MAGGRLHTGADPGAPGAHRRSRQRALRDLAAACHLRRGDARARLDRGHWIEGTHYIVDTAVESGSPENRTALAAELVQRKPDLLLAPGTPAIGPLMKATRNIPIVFFVVGDPVGDGFVSNLARPGGNVTGLGGLGLGLATKQLELLQQAVLHARRIGVLVHPECPGVHVFLSNLKAAAQSLSLELRQVVLRARRTNWTAPSLRCTWGASLSCWPAPARSRHWSPSSGCRLSVSCRS